MLQDHEAIQLQDHLKRMENEIQKLSPEYVEKFKETLTAIMDIVNEDKEIGRNVIFYINAYVLLEMHKEQNVSK